MECIEDSKEQGKKGLSLPHCAVSSKRMKSDKTALEAGNVMLYSIDAVTSFF